MRQDISLIEKAVEFHGHTCPGLIMGVRMAEAALSYLGVQPDRDEELLAIVENDSCSVDAIQAILSCTFGKGNLIFQDHGKQVVTVASRQQHRAVRIASIFQENPRPERQRYAELNRKGELTTAEKAERDGLRMLVFEEIMSAPLESMFTIREVNLNWPPKAAIHPTVVCQRCGEGVGGHRVAAGQNGRLCIPCSLELQT